MTERRLRIGIDARDLLVTPRTGVERVAYQLLDSLARVGDPDHEYVLLVHEEPTPGALPAKPPGEIVVEPVRFRRLQRIGDAWLTLQMRRVVAAQGLDGFLTPNTKFPFARVPRFTCVHGIEWHFCPGDYRKKELIKQRLWFRLCTRWSTGIVTFARATDEGIRRLRPRCRIPICVVPEGVDAMFRRLTDGERSAEALVRNGVHAPFVLSVCSLERRKNLDALVRAFASAVAQHDLPHQLVLVGRAGQTSSRLRDLIAEHGLEGHVHLPGYVDDDDLVQLYNQAELFVYPSKYEGFGLPVLEAMACGAPVVTSNRGAMIEVGGDAAVLADPHDDGSIAEAIATVLRDDERRAAMREAGLRHAGGYSWDEMTRTIVRFMDDRIRALRSPGDDASEGRSTRGRG
jgi:glycosyltransferase involved in cell wall biosynthesis